MNEIISLLHLHSRVWRSASKSKGGCNKNEAPNWLFFHICPPTCWLLMSMNADSSNLERFEWWDLTVQSPHSSWNSETKNALFAGEARLVTIKSQNALLFLVELSPPIIRSIARFKDAKKWQKKRAVRYVIHLEAGNQKFDANHQILCFPEVPIGFPVSLKIPRPKVRHRKLYIYTPLGSFLRSTHATNKDGWEECGTEKCVRARTCKVIHRAIILLITAGGGLAYDRRVWLQAKCSSPAWDIM